MKLRIYMAFLFLFILSCGGRTLRTKAPSASKPRSSEFHDILTGLWNDFKIPETAQLAAKNSGEQFFDLKCERDDDHGYRTYYTYCEARIRVSSKDECKARAIQFILNGYQTGKTKAYRVNLRCPDIKGVENWWWTMADWNTWKEHSDSFELQYPASQYGNHPDTETSSYLYWDP